MKNVRTERMTDLDAAWAAIRRARGLISNFAIIDPTLWPVLAEIDTTLMRGEEIKHRVLRGHEPNVGPDCCRGRGDNCPCHCHRPTSIHSSTTDFKE